ncbi:MAG: aminoglycoside phosphotransferase family protein [Oscillospiraceae bacterium]|nr:aminoglycoside phosphotransferase family protein [Oscillospiraceae bacterium]
MNINRINDFITLDKNDITALFAPFDMSIGIINFSLKDSMSNTGYEVTTTKGRFFLKLYSNTTDKIETAVYRYLKNKINVPKLFYYDGIKEKFPFTYTITEFIDGVSLISHVRNNLKYPPEKSFEIGRMCAAIHKKKYTHDALLDDKLNSSRELPYTRDKILRLINGKPGNHLNVVTVEKLKAFIGDNSTLFDRIEAESVLCHGDFGYGNIMISDEKIYLIDFEFAYAGSIYNDIGHFFRRKGIDVQALIDDRIYNSFADGYNSVSDTQLPSDWFRLARLCDINAMLCLLNHDGVPAEWIEDIEADILYSIC